MTAVEDARNRYGRDQVICGFKEFVIDLIATVDLARHLFKHKKPGIIDLMLVNDPYSLPSMSYIFGGSLVSTFTELGLESEVVGF